MSANVSTPLSSMNVCFYGAGSMAEAIIKGLISSKLMKPHQITVTNRQTGQRLRDLHDKYRVIPVFNEQVKLETFYTSDVIILCMKPKDAAEALRYLAPSLRPKQLIISVVAGLSLDMMTKLLGKDRALVRAMPNTSSTIGLGSTGICFGEDVSKLQRKATLYMFESIGSTTVVDESIIPAITGVSGSGPAYVYYFMESMIETGIKMGLTPEAAKELTIQTIFGAVQMVKITGEDPSDLRAKVTSPEGATHAAIKTLESFSFKESMETAMMRCIERADEMGENIRNEI